MIKPADFERFVEISLALNGYWLWLDNSPQAGGLPGRHTIAHLTLAPEKLIPGEGAIFFNFTSDYKSATFVDQLLQGSLSVPILPGFSIRSPLVPQPGS